MRSASCENYFSSHWFCIAFHRRWFLYKFPLAASARDDGMSYSWMSSSTPKLTASAKKVTDAASLLGSQLADVYARKPGVDHVFYNDQWPNGSWTEDYGHSKGAVVADAASGDGFFLHHSIPDFPNYVKDGYEYRRGEEKYGQSASCFTLAAAGLDAWAYAARFAKPWIFDVSFPSPSGNLSKLLAGDTFYDEKASARVDVGPVAFLAKAGAFGADLADDVLAPRLGADLVSQSWLDSGHPLGPHCGAAHTVVDTKTLKFGDGTVSWPTQDDHAKWTVAAKGEAAAWVCANDNNRDESQFKRGGLAVCLEDAPWRAALLAGVLEAGSCDGPSPGPAPGPSGRCCHHDDGHCAPGDVCCKAHCDDAGSCSYSEEGCSGEYGKIHHCAWDGAACRVGA